MIRHGDSDLLGQLCSKHTAVRAQFLFHVKHSIRQLYDLPDNATAIARRVDYLLERDRFICSPITLAGIACINYPQGICHHRKEHISELKLPKYGFPEGIWGTTQDIERVYVSRYG